MDSGQIAEVGDHESLIAQNGLYAKLYESQFCLRRFSLTHPADSYAFCPFSKTKERIKSSQFQLVKSQIQTWDEINSRLIYLEVMRWIKIYECKGTMKVKKNFNPPL